MPITNPTYSVLAEPGLLIAEAVFEMLVALHRVRDLPETPAENAAWAAVQHRMTEIREPVEALAARLGQSPPPLPSTDVTNTCAHLFALVLEARRCWRLAQYGEGSQTTIVEASTFSDVLSAL